MTVVLRLGSYGGWPGDDSGGVDALTELPRPDTSTGMTAYTVSSRVNSPHNQGEELIERPATDSV